MDGPDFFSIGQHCSVADCRQKDFLPFKCDCCHGVYCIEHRTYAGHNCEKASSRSPTTVICPLCARAIRLEPGQDPNLVFERHTTQDCDPSNYARVMRKQKCPVPACKEKLTSITTYTCKHCSTNVCLRHRFPDDHFCSKKPQQGATQPTASSSLKKLFGFGTTQAATQPPARQKGGNGPERNRLRPAVSGPGQRSGVLRAAAEQRSNPEQASTAERETCPVCRARFGNLQDLIAHSTTHEDTETGSDVCPHCHAIFSNAVALVEHVEQRHSSNPACVLC